MRYGRIFETRIGSLYIEEEAGFLVRLTSAEPHAEALLAETHLLCRAEKEVLEFLEGKRRQFTVPLKLYGTEFQRKVWEVLRKIPYGETYTYGQVAKLAGSPKSARAVGQACNRNPIMIIVPCHRVIGAGGKLVGFGGGLPMKEALLLVEQKNRAEEKR